MRKLVVLLLMVGPSLLATDAAHAISNGQLDGTTHPNVAAVLFQDTSGEFIGLCGSSLLSPTVLLSTAHCAADAKSVMADGGRVWATFDPNVDPGTTLLAVSSTAISPDFNPNSGLFDLGVLVLAAPVNGIAPVQLPTFRQLDGVKKNQPFAVVGYGVAVDCSAPGLCIQSFDLMRRRAGERASTTDGGGGIEFQMNTSATGLGGTCYGDGGDPDFLGSSSVQASVHDGGAGFGAANNPCHSAGFGYRLDTRQARSFLAGYVSVP